MVGSYRGYHSASKRLEQMKKQGHEAFIRRHKGRYQVWVGPFATRKEAEAWLEADPYVQQNVWGNITLTACKMGPSFEPLFNQIYKKSA